MKRRSRWLGGLVAAGLALSACSSGGQSQTDVVVDAAAATETAESAALLSGQFDTIGGGSIDLATLEGQDVVLWFWAPW